MHKFKMDEGKPPDFSQPLVPYDLWKRMVDIAVEKNIKTLWVMVGLGKGRALLLPKNYRDN